MKQWRIWAILALIACLPIFWGHSTSPSLLTDSDTTYLLKAIREKQAPLSWFMGDWPLKNHFYRPLPTLAFELDNKLYGNNAAGYGWTNDILCVLCVLSLFWLIGELLSSPFLAFLGAWIFALWNIDNGYLLAVPCMWLAGAVVLIGLYRHSFRISRYIPAALVLVFLSLELLAPQMSINGHGQHPINWLPGRTASVMALFALIAMAAYVRYERARNRWLPPLPATALDRPTATRTGTRQIPKNPGFWLGITILATIAAFASYEQAVMLPAILLAQAVYLKLQRRQPNWPVHLWFWGILAAYMGLRHFVLPAGISTYQAQQLRHGPAAYQDLGMYLLPNTGQLYFLGLSLSEGIVMLLAPAAFATLLNFFATVTTIVQARRKWQLITTGWVISTLAFLPMAWVKQFDHYHFFPLALRTIFVLGVGQLAWNLVTTAASPPELQAPPRPSPAPGSLPHP
jgi:hypothetical protein